MKSSKLNTWGLAVLLNALMVPVLAGVESHFEVGTWGNFCDGAISHTFDDNTAGQLSKGVPAFNEKGFHMTMFVVTSWVGEWSGFKDAFDDGHEIASHGSSHPNGQAEPASNLKPSQETIKQNVPGEMCVTFAYPNCKPVHGVTDVYIAARTCGSDNPNSKSPSDWTGIQSRIFGEPQGPNDAQSMNSFANTAANQNGWSVYLHHGVGEKGQLVSKDHQYTVTDINALKEHLDYLDENRDKIWCETFGNVARYIKERDAVSLSVTSSDDNSITVSVTDNLDNSIYDYPLSIRRPLPDGWTDPVVTQDGEEVEFSVEDNNIVFKAVPDGGEVVISRDPVRALKHLSHKNSGSSPVVLKNSVLLIDQQYFNGSELAVTIFNLTGKMLGSYKTGKNESRIVLPAGKINRAAFVAKITGKDKTLIQKFMPQM